MRSVISTAVLATALFSQAFAARGSPHRHGHQHLHAKKAEDFPKRAVGDMVVATIDGVVVSWANNYDGGATASVASSAAATSVAASSSTSAAAAVKVVAKASSSSSKSAAATSSSASSKTSSASQSSSTASSGTLSSMLSANKITEIDNPSYDGCPIGIGSGGAFEFEITNDASEDIVIVLWSSNGQEGDWDAQSVQVNAPNLTFALGCGETESISFNPSAFVGGSISGAFSVLSSKSAMVNAYISNTWGEFTVTESNIFSTLDVSRILNLNGNGMSIQLYESKGGSKTCLSDMTTCVYLAEDSISGCVAGTPGTSVNAANTAGGCMFSSTTGYASVSISD